MLADVDRVRSTQGEITAAAAGIAHAREQQRQLETEGLHDALLGVLEHPRWDDVADRCGVHSFKIFERVYCGGERAHIKVTRYGTLQDYAKYAEKWNSLFAIK